MSSRNMSLLRRATLHSDSEQAAFVQKIILFFKLFIRILLYIYIYKYNSTIYM
jgi:hypothetical protein